MVEVSPEILQSQFASKNRAAVPAAHDDDLAREKVLRRIEAEIDHLQQGSPSEEIRQLIREMQALSGQVKSGLVPPSVANTKLKQFEERGRTELAEVRAKEMLTLVQSISSFGQTEQYYKMLSKPARERVDTVYHLLSQSVPLTREEEVTVIQNLAGPSELAGPKALRVAAERAQMVNPDVVDALKKNPESARAAHVQLEHNSQQIDKHIATAHDPATKKHLKNIKEMGLPTEELAEKIKACNGSCDATAKLEQEVSKEWESRIRRNYSKYLGTLSAEQQQLIAQNGGVEGLITRAREMRNDPARAQAAREYNEGNVAGASEQTKADAAGLSLRLASRSGDMVNEAFKIAQEIEAKKGRQSNIFDQSLSQEQRAQFLIEEYRASGKGDQGLSSGKDASGADLGKSESHRRALQAQDEKLALSVIKQMDAHYSGDVGRIAKASSEDIKAISKAASADVVSMRANSFFDTRKETTQAVIKASADKAYAEALLAGKSKKEAQEEAAAAAARDRFGANVKNTAVHLWNGDGSKAVESLNAAATQVTTKLGSVFDSATAAMGFKTFDNQIAANMDAINTSSVYVNVSNGYDKKIFNTDGKGKISQAELTKVLEDHGFKDAKNFGNGDDTITQKEMTDALNKIMQQERKAGVAKKIEAVAKQHIDADFAKGLKNSKIVFTKDEVKTFDKNGDGKLDVADKDNIIEVLKKKGIDLNAFDKDKNGIDIKELSDAMHKAAETPASAKKPQPAGKGH